MALPLAPKALNRLPGNRSLQHEEWGYGGTHLGQLQMSDVSVIAPEINATCREISSNGIKDSVPVFEATSRLRTWGIKSRRSTSSTYPDPIGSPEPWKSSSTALPHPVVQTLADNQSPEACPGDLLLSLGGISTSPSSRRRGHVGVLYRSCYNYRT